MATCEPEMTYRFDVKVETGQVVESKVEFGSGTCREIEFDMRRIVDDDGETAYPDGPHRVPFWACGAIVDAVKSSGKTRGWLTLEYRRLISERNGKTYNTAELAL